ncbi:MAG: immune inhibitor A [Candidatus Thermoplasmatota archaeon]|nr:immune inhibitor A [Candidatus Thermoplasmatota archaeon]
MRHTRLCLTLIALLVLMSFSVPAGQTSPVSLFTTNLVRIDTTQGDITLPRGAEVVSGNPGQWLDIILPHLQLAELTKRGIPYTILIQDVDAYSQAFTGQYHTLAEIEQILQTIASTYPSITSLYSIGTTYQGRDIWCLEITDNPGVDEGEPGVFYMGLHHAREWPTVEICLNIANQLTSQYGSNTTITNLVNNRRLWLVTCVNPDGYYYCHDQNHDWRKNRHYFPEFGTYGVDLNRNYAGSCNGNPAGSWGSVGDASVTHEPGNEVYCGPMAMSELEVQAIRDIFLDNDICAAITWHTYGELVLWPWGYSGSEHTPDNTYLSQVGQQIASRITRQSGSGTYTPQQAAGLYPTTGDTVDWAYGHGYYEQGRVTFPFTIEACSSFHPAAGALDQIVMENFDAAMYLLQEAGTINTVVPQVLPPVLDDLTTDPDGTYQVSWQQQNPAANPDVYQLDELTGVSMGTDDAEVGSTLWDLTGFSLSTARYHSGAKSYKARSLNSDVSAMTTVYPTPVTPGMMLSFWCWYNVEEDYDYAFVEVSRDGRCYDILQTFNGQSSSWEYHEYDLSNYTDDSVFIRFRYTTDQGTLGEGFYVDDIAPVTYIETITTLSDTITNEYYDITGQPNGTYYYRVRGHNSERGWGDDSTLEKIEVTGGGGDTTPPSVEITTPLENQLYLFDRVALPFFTTVIIGKVTITVNTTDASGIDHVEFFIDGTPVFNDSVAPFSWVWKNRVLFTHTITVVSYDIPGNHAETSREVRKFL